MINKHMKGAAVLALGAGLIAPTFAHASLITTSANAAFSVNKSVSDTLPGVTASSNGATTLTNQVLGTTQVNQFNASTGVLTGVTVNLTSTQTQTTAVTTPGASGNNGGDASASGTGTSSIHLVVPNSVVSTDSTATASDSCAGKPKDLCSNGPTTKTVNDNLTVNSSNLNAYAGNGTFGAGHVASTLSADTTANSFNAPNTATTTSTVNWDGTLSATYSYLLHAAQSFNPLTSSLSLTLDFGSVYLGDTVSSQSFGISNLAGDRVGLSLSGFTETGDTSNLFSTNLANFSGLGQGTTNNFSASFLANAIGTFGAKYSLTLEDFAPTGPYASNTLGSGYSLTLNVLGNVIERPQVVAVPEPGSLALLGLGSCAFLMRRRNGRWKNGAGSNKA
jgi:hypothetical protein